MHVHLVDGTYELFRSYFGAPQVRAADGREVGAVRGLLASLGALLRDPHTTHVAVAFDTVIESFRNDLFAGYKTGEGMPEDLWAQFPLAERAVRALGCVVWPMVEFEADDGLASGAARFAADPRVERVYLCTPDKDLAQMVQADRVVQFDRKQRKVFDAGGVRQKFGVDPESIPDWLALVGDQQDGIPGVPKWGAKSAALVLSSFRHLDRIPQDPVAWQVPVRGARALAASLAAHREDALLYRELATLRTDVPITEELEDLRVHGPSADLPVLCSEIGFERFLERGG
ncbi:MAG: flap endonuclease [Planctomycetes bacterium]|nr:flap endonuclease [Planctomycetota bacterium]MCB9888926.1 flap endonuclease [Planctomycetota bacterium]